MDKHFHHMKTLILMRHAKAQHISSDLTDLHRSLVHQGIEDAKQSAKKLIKHELKIDELILSPSTRTIETDQVLVGSGALVRIRSKHIAANSGRSFKKDIDINACWS